MMPIPPQWENVDASGACRSEGGQAWVYEARRSLEPGGDVYAVKVFKDSRRRERAVREVAAMQDARTSGVPVIEIIEAGTFSTKKVERYYYAMLWSADGSLEQAVIDRRFVHDPLAGLRVLRQLAEALQALHLRGVAHRDLKPDNLLLDGRRLLLADFGLMLPVEAADRLTATSEVVGSRFYIAPEQESGLNTASDHRAVDFYAFAKILWALLAGSRPPAREATVEEDAYRLEHVSGQSQLATLRNLQVQLLRRDPRTRLQDWTEVLMALDNAAALYAAAPGAERGDVATVSGTGDVAAQIRALAERRHLEPRTLRHGSTAIVNLTERAQEVQLAYGTELMRWRDEFQRLNEDLPAAISVSLNGGTGLTIRGGDYNIWMLSAAGRHRMLEADLGNGGVLELQGGNVCRAEFTVASSDGPAPSVRLRGFLVRTGSFIWLVRDALLGEPWQSQRPDWLFEAYGHVAGPFDLEMPSTEREATRCAREFGEAGQRMLLSYMTRDQLGHLDEVTAWLARLPTDR